MLHWLRYPFIRFTPAFALGIVGFEFLGQPQLNWPVVVILTSSIFVLLFISRRRFFSLNPFFGGLLLLLMIVFGFISATLRYQIHSSDHIGQKTFSHYKGVVNTWPEKRNNYVRMILQVEQVKDSIWIPASGKIQIYLPEEPNLSITYGTELVVKGSPDITNPPGNPFEFDYKAYLEKKNVFHQDFLNNQDILISGMDPPNMLISFSGQLREKAIRILSKRINKGEELGIAKAMLLGDRTDMDEEIREAYAHAGAMHILAISGLHVGILYGLLALILAPLKRNRKSKIIFVAVILIVLWSYALVVGGSPSVIRAVVMFSLITAGQAFYRPPNIFNTIAFSALLLLVINPFLLFDVGFQLSYLAVTGIVLLHRSINSWITSRYYILNFVWSITAVAIAAQMVTLPLSLYYFHNFPGLFFVSNLVVIPSAFVILISGLFLLFSSVFSFQFLVDFFGMVLSNTIGLMNRGVIFIESIPNSHVSDIYLSGYATGLLYLLIFAGLASLLLKNVKWLYIFFIMWICFFINISIAEDYRQRRHSLMIYDINDTTVMDYVSQGSIKTISGKQPGKDIGYHVDNFRITMGGSTKPIHMADILNISSGIKLLAFGDKSLVWIDDKLNHDFRPMARATIDYLLISNNSVEDINFLLEMFNPGLIVIDSSNDYFYSGKIENQLIEKGMLVYNTRRSGGLLIDFNR